MIEKALPYLFISPSFFFLITFIIIPIGLLIYISMTTMGMSNEPVQFIGLRNYKYLYENPVFWQAFFNTVIFVVFAVGFRYAIALGLASLLNRPIRGIKFFRGVLMIPFVLPVVPAIMSWRWIYNRNFGVLDVILPLLGLKPVDWLGTPGLSIYMVIIAHIWKYYPMITLFLLAGMQGISRDLYEAAKIDGAGTIANFRFITWPGIRRLFQTLLIFSLVGTTGEFLFIYLTTGGGPLYTSNVLATLGFTYAFQQFNFGLGAAVFVYLLPATFSLMIFGTWRMLKAE